MILLLLGMARDYLFYNSPRRRLDRIDHFLMAVIQTCLVILFVTLPHVVLSEEQLVDTDFFSACSDGKVDTLKTMLAEHPGWVNAKTTNGESCLHLAGIFGHSEITETLLVNGADPNIRSTFEQGLRMHPLSWNVYGGHVANVDLLLKHGANVNLDFDSMTTPRELVTVLDIVQQLITNESGDDRFTNLEKLLVSYGAMTWKDFQASSGAEL